jgi:hypothetical protein
MQVVKKNTGRAMTQVVSHRLLTAEVQVRARLTPYGICGEKSGTGTGSSPSCFSILVSIFPQWLSMLIGLMSPG